MFDTQRHTYPYPPLSAQEANNYFLRAIQSNSNDSYAIFQYAQFLDRCGLVKKAEEFYLRSLEVENSSS